MSQKALGMIETVGILAAYEAADVALKSANVKMVGYEISRGGLIVIKFTGDVSAVRSAVDAGKTAASKLSKVWSSHVIARPAEQIEKMINSEDTINNKNKSNSEAEKEETEDISEAEIDEDDKSSVKSDDLEAESKESNEEAESKGKEEKEDTEELEEEDICNLCGDPACPRNKGDLHTDCIHYDEIKGDKE
jgi:microcompartment protein CcmL/EutN